MATKLSRAFFSLFFLWFFMSISSGFDAYQLEYRIAVHADGSAIWIIEHVFVKGEEEAMFAQLSNPTYFRGTFIENIKSLSDTARQETGRLNMTVENFAMNASVSGSYSIVKYEFNWMEFAETEDTQIKIGDVFDTEGLFLFGEGTVEIECPSGYAIKSVSPRPKSRAGQKLKWRGIQDFGAGEPEIMLEERATSGFVGVILENSLAILGLIAFIVSSSVSLYYLKLRKKEVTVAKPPVLEGVVGIEYDEDKVVNLLRAAGGSMYQSKIADRCNFSRSKTSKLLTAMESEGKIRREKRGRERIVTLLEGD